MDKTTSVETLAQRLVEAVTIAARDHGYRPKVGKIDTSALRDTIADWIEANMEPKPARVPNIREKVEA